jgi:hypothetical protein
VRAALLAIALTASGCSLIVSGELSEARQRADAGTGGGSTGTGGGGAGGGSETGGGSAAGGGSATGGGSAAGGGSAGYDGGLPCPQSSNPRLACTLLLTFDAGTTTTQYGGPTGAVAANDNAFITIVAPPGLAHGVEVTRQPIAGGASSSTQLTSPNAGDAPMVAAAAAGSHWAVAWIYPLGSATGDLEVACLSDLDNNTPRRYPLGTMTSGIPWASVAVGVDGSVAIAASTYDSGFNFGTWFAHSAAGGGCPTMLPQTQDFGSTTVRQSFVVGFPQGGYLYGVSDMTEVVLDDLTHTPSYVSTGGDQQALFATMSSDGNRVLFLIYDAAVGDVQKLVSLSSNATNPGTPGETNVLSQAVAAEGLSGCGTHCNAVTYIPSSATSFNLVVSMFTDVPDNARTYDAKCGVSSNDLVAASAYSTSTQRLGVLWGNASAGELYRCTLPP